MWWRHQVSCCSNRRKTVLRSSGVWTPKTRLPSPDSKRIQVCTRCTLNWETPTVWLLNGSSQTTATRSLNQYVFLFFIAHRYRRKEGVWEFNLYRMFLWFWLSVRWQEAVLTPVKLLSHRQHFFCPNVPVSRRSVDTVDRCGAGV